MVLDAKITQLKNYFGISKPEDWCDVEPRWILAQHGIANVTLDHVRMYLAARDLTLKGDRTPEYWKQNLSAVKIGHTMGSDEPEDGDQSDRGIMSPFTVLVDTQEQHPYTFANLFADADQKHRPLIVPTMYKALGRHPDGLGDYSIEGGQGRVHVERKSMEDAQGTILGWSGRRERFERELANLQQIEAPLVVVECSFGQLVAGAKQRGARSAADNAKILARSVLKYQQDFRVPWMFCDTRRMAEQFTFRFLERWWRKQREEMKRAGKEQGKELVQI